MDRWEIGFRNIVTILVGSREEFSIPAIVELVRSLKAEQRRLLDTYRAIAVDGLGLTDPLADDSPDDAEQAGWDGLLSGKVAALRRERDALKAEKGSLLRKPEPPPAGCFCGPGKCGAPVIMGRQMPCRRSETQAVID